MRKKTRENNENKEEYEDENATETRRERRGGEV